MGLVSKWADSDDLVAQAIDQDKKSIKSKKGEPLVSKWASPVTSEKGKPLASRWATADDAADNAADKVKEKSTFQDSSPSKYHDNHTKHNNKSRSDIHNHEQRSPGKTYHGNNDNRTQSNNLSSRISNLKIDDNREGKIEKSPPSKNFNSRINTPVKQVSDDEDQWEDQNSDEDEGEEEGDIEEPTTAPTKAAQDFASRLGISLNVPKGPKSYSAKKEQIQLKRDEERKNIRNKKIESRNEWDHDKPGTKIDHSFRKDRSNVKSPNSQSKKPVVVEAKPAKSAATLQNFVLEPGTNWADLSDDEGF